MPVNRLKKRVSVPKIKTHKGAASRFKITGSGKLVHAKVGRSHFRRRKPPRVKRDYHGEREIDPANRSRIKRVFPYG